MKQPLDAQKPETQKPTSGCTSAPKVVLKCNHCGGHGHGEGIDCISHTLGCVCKAVELSASRGRSFRKTGFPGSNHKKIPQNVSPPFNEFQRTQQNHFSYLEYLRKQLKLAEEDRIDYKKRTLEAENRVQCLRQEIYQVAAKDAQMVPAHLSNIDTIVRTNKEKRFRQLRLREEQERTMIDNQEHSRRVAEKEHEAIEELLTERRMRIIQNITKIRNRSELRKAQDALANRMISALKQVNEINS
jgi:hypothetical protein